jgi:hypothetical protein
MTSSIQTCFDVNDTKGRIDFLQNVTPAALDALSPSDAARWGHMTPQQMVEHLIWALEASNGRIELRCSVHPKLVAKIRGFLFENTPTSREFMNPELKKGSPPLRFTSMLEARQELKKETERFLSEPDNQGARLRAHPVFGDLNHAEWERSHYKHFFHHLLQFGLIEQLERPVELQQ